MSLMSVEVIELVITYHASRVDWPTAQRLCPECRTSVVPLARRPFFRNMSRQKQLVE